MDPFIDKKYIDVLKRRTEFVFNLRDKRNHDVLTGKILLETPLKQSSTGKHYGQNLSWNMVDGVTVVEKQNTFFSL